MNFKTLSIVVGTLVVLALVPIYHYFPPETTPGFPRCPFRLVTGYQCPGCGSQRAIHHLLNLRVGKAFAANPLLVISLPYLLLGFFIEYTPWGTRLWGVHRLLYGRTAAWVAFFIVCSFWLGRNLV
jgi:hypothetical protein